MNKLTIKAYAKLNLFLDITGRRSDGYHELKTVMQSITLCDELEFALFGGKVIEITCDRTELPLGKDNLVYKGIEAALNCRGYDLGNIGSGIKVHLKKNIPSQAGMGGGSADCAAAITAANELFNLSLTADELMQAGKLCGADVPFCLKGGTALCEGIGEKLTPLSLPDSVYFAVSKPDEAISTPQAYRQFDISGKPSAGGYRDLEKAMEEKNTVALGRSLYNAFTKVCAPESVLTEIERLKAQGAVGAEMTGSGSAVFGMFTGKDTAVSAADKCTLPFRGVYLPSGCGVEIVR